MGILNRKVALITGGASGIGRATALLLASEGASCCIADINGPGTQETARLIKANGGVAAATTTDVAQETDVQAMIAACKETFGRLDILFSNAGTLGKAHGQPLHEIPLAHWQFVVDVNLTSMFLCAKYAIPLMIEQGGGVVVNTSSTKGIVGGYNCAYAATKHGVVGLTKYLALYYAKYNIRANCIAPGATETGLDEAARKAAEGRRLPQPPPVDRAGPMGRSAKPEEIAQAVLYLASDRSSFVTGTCLVIDGGVTAI
ncbi:MAG: SDR family oxidoreductase [Chloroflexi bacterium]|nr:SDR family oxidoreductase [Chloroflexota bacterium]